MPVFSVFTDFWKSAMSSILVSDTEKGRADEQHCTKYEKTLNWEAPAVF